MRRRVAVAIVAGLLFLTGSPGSAQAQPRLQPHVGTPDADVVVYAATPGGILAAVTAGRAGARVSLLEPSGHVGGMMSNGLSFSDVGNAATLGGYTREVFDRIEAAEGTSWGRFHFEPHVAEQVFADMLVSADVTVYLHQELIPGGVGMAGSRITSITTATGLTLTGSVFVDASYEGDLLAAAGGSYRVGRESSSEFGESLAGVRPSHRVMTVPSGLSPGSLTPPPGPVGSGDASIQDANYRICFSDDPENQVAFTAPAGYEADDYALVAAYFDARMDAGFAPQLAWVLTVSPLAGRKYDVNSQAFSLSLPGVNWPWPDGNTATRAAIADTHATWDQGVLFFLETDPRVPTAIRSSMARYGLCADEFTDNANWPRMLYNREARRMVGEYVMTQRDVETQRSKADIIAVGSYRVDSHAVSLWVDDESHLNTEGTLSLPYRTYAIPYRSITPLRSEVTNLLVPVAVSATHVAYASLRMEPHFMLTGEAAGQAAWLAASKGTPAIAIQDVSVGWLQAELRAHGSFLQGPAAVNSGGTPFTDVESSIFEGDIVWLYESEVTTGCSSTTFCPDEFVTRGQMAAFLDRALALRTTSTDYFTDDSGTIFEMNINRLAASEITTGCSPTTFCPDDAVTRGQMAAFLDRALALPKTTTDYFTDDSSSIFEKSINRLASSGITTGCSATTFCPDDVVTRGQMAAFLHRALK